MKIMQEMSLLDFEFWGDAKVNAETLSLHDLEKIDKEDDIYYFSKIFGNGYAKNEDDLFPFSGDNYWHVLYE
jgi:hypothetical protein